MIIIYLVPEKKGDIIFIFINISVRIKSIITMILRSVYK